MAKLVLDWHSDNDHPRRGDILHSATKPYFVLSVRMITRRAVAAVPRFDITVVHGKEMEPELEEALTRSANRRGGRQVYKLWWNPRKKKRKTFEDLMRQSRL
jgi:hypothetical protein